MKRNPRILLIEDNPGDVLLIRRTFEECGIDATLDVVDNAVQAFSYLGRQGAYAEQPAPDLVILDLRLPIIDGQKVLRVIKGTAEWRDLPVIVFSSSAQEADRSVCRRLGAVSYQVKPTLWHEYLALGRHFKDTLENGCPDASPEALAGN